jgi:hypothetical protein
MSRQSTRCRSLHRVAPVLMILGALASTQSAVGQIFVSKQASTVGEYAPSGVAINPSFISGALSYDLAAADGKLYVVTGNTTGARLGVYDAATGAALNPSLVALPYTSGEYSLAVSGSNLFVARSDTGTVAKYTTAGTPVNTSLITGLNEPFSLAVSEGKLFVANTSNNVVGEYTTDGAVVNASLVTGVTDPFSVTVQGNDLFVLSKLGGTVGKYDATTGAAINSALVTGLHEPFDLAVFGDRLYVTDTNASRVGEYTTSGATVNASLISSPGFGPFGIIVVPEPSSVACCALAAAVALPRRRRS